MKKLFRSPGVLALALAIAPFLVTPANAQDAGAPEAGQPPASSMNVRTTNYTVQLTDGSGIALTDTEDLCATISLTASTTADIMAMAQACDADTVEFVSSPLDGFTVKVPAGTSTAIFTVVLVDDKGTADRDIDDGVTVSITDVSGGVRGDPLIGVPNTLNSALEQQAAVSISRPAPIQEGSFAVFTVSLPALAVSQPAIMLTWTVVASTTSAADFTAMSGTFEISGADNDFLVAVPIVRDRLAEPDETFTLVVTAPPVSVTTGSGEYPLRGGSREAIIPANDPLTAELDGAGTVLKLGDGMPTSYTVRLTDGGENALAGSTAVNFTVAVTGNFELCASAEEQSCSATTTTRALTLAAGDSELGFRLKPTDAAVHGDVGTLTLTNFTGGGNPTPIAVADSIANPLALNVSIGAVVSVTEPNTTVEEGADAVFTLNIPQTVPEDIVLTWSVTVEAVVTTSPAVENAEGTATIAAGETQAPVTIMIRDDPWSEPQEIVTLTVTAASSTHPDNLDDSTYATYSTTRVPVIIEDVEGMATIAASDPVSVSLRGPAALNEGRGGTYQVSIDGGITGSADVCVTVRTRDLGADDGTANDDFEVEVATEHLCGDNPAAIREETSDRTFTLRIARLENSVSFRLHAVDDAAEVTETGANEEILLTLEEVTGGGGPLAGSGPSAGINEEHNSLTVTITDDVPRISIAPGVASVTEGSDAIFILTASPTISSAFTVDVTIEGGAAFGVTGGDADPPVRFSAGAATAMLTVPTTNDNDDEPDDTVTATLQASDFYLLGATSSASVTLRDDDVVVTLAVSATEVSESGRVTLTVTANEDVPVQRAVGVQVAVGTSSPVLREITLATSTRIAMHVEDIAAQDNEVVNADAVWTMTLASGVGYEIGTASSVAVTVRDDDVAVSIAGPTAPVSEAAGAVELVLTGSEAPLSPFSVIVALEGGDTFGIPDADHEIVFGPGDTTKTLPLELDDDDEVEAGATLTATLQPGLGFRVSASSTATVTLADDDVVIAIAPGPSPVTEGDDATFVLTATPAPVAALTVNIALTGGAAFGVPEGMSDRVGFNPGEFTATLSVKTRNDDDDEPDGTLTATLGPGLGYTLGAPTSTSVTLADNDVVLTLGASATTTPESGKVTISVNANEPLPADLPVTLMFAQERSVMIEDAGGTITVTPGDHSITINLAANTTSTTFTLAAVNNDVADVSASVAVSLPQRGGVGYESGTPSEVEFTITDDDAQVSIAPPSSPGVEGGEVVFTLTVDPAPAETITVNVALAGGASFGAPNEAQPMFDAGTGMQLLTVTLATRDDVFTSDGTLTATVLPGVGYSVGAPSEVTVLLLDDDLTVSIAPGPSPVTEGATSTFLLTATPARAVAFTVNVTLDGGVAFGVPESAAPLVTFDAGELTATLSVRTENDNDDEPDATLTATLQAGLGYTLGAPTSTSVTLADNDVTLTLGASTTTIPESGEVTIAVNANEAPPADLPVDVIIATGARPVVVKGSGDPLTISPMSGNAVVTLTLDASTTSATFTLAAVDNDIIDAAASVEVSLAEGGAAGYETGTPSSVELTITDDDVELNLSVSAKEVAEDGQVTFTVLANEAPPVDRVVQLLFIEGATPAESHTIPLPDNVRSITRTVDFSLDDDDLVSADVTLTIRLAPGAGYQIGASSSVTVTVRDNDVAVSIAGPTDPVSEAGTVELVLTASEAPLSPFTVNVTVAGGETFRKPNDDGGYTNEYMVEFEPGEDLRKTLLIELDDDTMIEKSETLTAIVQPGLGFSVGASSTTTVMLTDNDVVIAIKSDPSSVMEGEEAIFILTTAIPPVAALTVNVTLAGGKTFGVAEGPVAPPVTLGAGEFTAVLTVKTEDDDVDEPDDIVTAMLEPGAGYTVHTPSSASVVVADNDVAVALTASTLEVSESGQVTLTVTANENPPVPRTVQMQVAVPGAVPMSREFALATSTRIATLALDIAARDNDIVNADMVWTMTLVAGAGYEIGTASSVAVTVRDDDVSVSIAGPTGPVSEAGAVELVLTASEAPLSPFTVSVTVEGGEAFRKRNDDGGYTNEYTIEFETGGDLEKTLIIDLDDDTVAEAGVTLTATVQPGLGFRVGANSTATVTLVDDDVVIGIAAGSSPVTEGEEATFTLTATPAPVEEIMVNVTLAGGATFDVPQGAVLPPVTFGADESIFVLTVETQDDNIDEANEIVTATLEPGLGYMVGVSSSSAAVTVADDDVEVNLTASATEVSESGRVTLTVTANENPPVPRTVQMQVTIPGSTPVLREFALATSTRIAALALDIAARDNDIVNADVVWTMTLVGGAGYEIGTASSVAVTVRDDDVSVSITGPTDPVSEAGTVELVLTGSAPPLSPFTVNVAVSGGATFGVPDRVHPIVFGLIDTTKTLPLQLDDDNEPEAGATLTATLQPGLGFRVGASSTARVMLTDDDVVIAITASSSPVTEGGEATFLLTATPAPAEEITVNVTLAGGAAFDVTEGAVSPPVTFAAGKSSATLAVKTTDDYIDDPDGILTATIGPGSGYAVGASSSAAVTILDDDVALTLAASATTVLEGGEVTIAVRANEAPAADLPVELTIGTDSRTVEMEDGARTLTIEPGAGTTVAVLLEEGSTTTTFLLSTVKNDVVEATGRVEVLLPADGGPGYETRAPARVEFAITDDHVVSIAAPSSPVGEGGEVVLTLMMAPAPAETITVSVAISGSTAFGVPDTTRTVEFEADDDTRLLPIDLTTDDTVFTTDDTLTATVEARPGYSIGTPSEATVLLLDDDLAVSIAPGPSPVTEGATSTFILTAAPARAVPFTVNVTLAGGAAFDVSQGAVAPPVAFDAGESTVTLAVPTRNDDIDESGDIVTATLESGIGYTVGATSSAEVTVEDDDVVVNLTASALEVSESGRVTLTVSANENPPVPRTVQMQVAVPGSAPVLREFILATSTRMAVHTEDIAARDNNIVNADVIWTMTLVGGTGYELGASSSVAITVRDDDVAVSIAGPTDPVSEDAEVELLLTASATPISPFMVTVTVAGGEAFRKRNDIGGYTNEYTFEFEAGGDVRKVLLLELDDDIMVEKSERLTATVQPGLGFRLDATLTTTVTLVDDDVVIAIAAGSSPVTEGEEATFILTATPAPVEEITMNVTLTGGAAFDVRQGAVLPPVTFAAGERTAVLTVRTDNDNTNEPDGIVTATLEAGIGYRVGATSSAEMTVRDDDVVVSLAASALEVSESGQVTLTVTANENPPVPRTVQMQVAVPGSAPVLREFILATSTRMAVHTEDIAARDNNIVNADVVWTMMFASGIGYEIGVASSVAITVRDDDVAVSIAGPTDPVSEDAEVELLLTASATPISPFMVTVTVAGGEAFRKRNDIGGYTNEYTFEFEAGGDVRKVLLLELDDDIMVEKSERLTATVQPGLGFRLDATSTTTVTLVDDDVVLEIAASSSPVTEGEEAIFILTATPAPVEEITVNVTLTGGVSFNVPQGAVLPPVTFDAGDGTATLAVETTNDNTDEPDDIVTATLEAGIGYTVGATSSAEVTVRDDDVVVALTASATEVAESGRVTLTVTANENPPVPRTVQMQVAVPGSAPMLREIVLATSTRIATFVEDISARDNDDINADVVWTMTLVGGTGYEIGASSSVAVTVRDDDVSVSIAGPTAPVSEADAVELILTASAAPLSPFAVSVALEGGTAFRKQSGDPPPVTFEAGATSKTLLIELNDDDEVEAGAMLTATLQPGLGFRVGASSTATVALTDDDVVIEIAASSSPVTEGEEATFILTAAPTPVEEITVNITLSGGAAFDVSEGPVAPPVVFGASESTVLLTVKTENDDIDESNDIVTATLEAGTGYTLGATSSAEVEVTDDDVVLTLAASALEVSESGRVTLTVSANEDVPVARTVGFEVAVGTSSPVLRQIALATSTRFAMHVEDIAARDNEVVNADVVWTMTLVSGTGYQIGTASSVAVTVRDDDVLVSIAGPTDPVSEAAGAVELVLAGSEAPLSPFTVNVAVSGGGAFGVSDEVRPVVFEVGTTSKALLLELDDDTLAEAGAMLTATLQPGLGFSVSATSSATVMLVDDDVVIAIAASSSPVTEGGEATFLLTAMPTPVAAISVNVTLAGGAAFDVPQGAVFPPVTFSAGDGTAVLAVKTTDDNTDESHGILTATIETGLGYMVGATSSAEVTVADDDVLVGLTASAIEVAESGQVILTVSANEDVPVQRTVGVQIDIPGSGPASREFILATSTRMATLALDIAARDNDVVNTDAVWTMTLVGGAGYEIGASSSVTVTVRDDDVAASIAGPDAPVPEDDDVVLILTASDAPLSPFTVRVGIAGGEAFRKRNDDGGHTNEYTIEFEAGGDLRKTLILELDDDEEVEAPAILTATLQPGLGFRLGASSTTRVTLADNETTISIQAGTSPVTEGGETTFTLIASPPPVAAIAVNITFAGGAAFGVPQGPVPPVLFGAGVSTSTLPVRTQNDDIDEADDIVTATVEAGIGYMVGATSSAQVTVTDDDILVDLTVSALEVSESGQVTLTVHANENPPVSRTVGIRVDIPGSAPMSREIVLATSTRMATLIEDISARDNDVVNADVVWTMTLVGGVGYEIGASSSVAVTVRDDDIVVSIAGPDTPVPEDIEVEFVLTASAIPLSPFTMRVALEGGTAFGVPDGPRSIMFGVGETRKTMLVDLFNDTEPEASATLTATVQPRLGFSVGASSTAIATLADNDFILSIAIWNSRVTEGNEATFVLTSVPATLEEITVNVTFFRRGPFGFQLLDLDRPFVFDAGRRMQTLNFLTDHDDIDEPDEVLVAALRSGIGYTVGAPASAALTVVDDDVVMTLSASTTAVAESGEVTLTVHANEPPPVARVVTLQPTYDGVPLTPVAILLPAGMQSATGVVSVAGEDDDVVDADSTLTVSLAPGTGYEIGMASSTTFTVRDDDVLVSFEPINSEFVPENLAVALTLTASEAPLTPFTVTVTIEGGSTFGVPDAHHPVVFDTDDTMKVLTFPLDDDREIEPGATLTATLQPGLGFRPGARPSAMVALEDNDLVISIDILKRPGVRSYRTEGEDATFVLTANANAIPDSPFAVGVRLSGGEAIGVPDTATTVEFMVSATGETIVNLVVPTENDNRVDPNRTILTATLLPGDSYTVGGMSSASILVLDDDVALSLSASAAAIPESGAVTISLSVDDYPPRARDVALTIAPERDVVIGTEPPRTIEAGTSPEIIFTLEPNERDPLTFTLSAVDNDILEPTASVTVSLPPEGGTGYETVAAASSVALTIHDDDVVVSIAGPTEPVSEHSAVELVLTAHAPAITPFTVTVAVSGGDTFRSPDDNASEYEIEFRTLSQIDLLLWMNSPETFELTRTLTLDLDNDAEIETGATLTATLQPGLDFRLGATSTATVELADDDVVVSIVSADTSIMEGSAPDITLLAPQGPVAQITLTVEISGGAAFGVPDGPRTISFTIGQTQEAPPFPTQNDDIVEPNGTLTVTVLPGPGYRPGASSSVMVTLVSEDVPTITVTSSNPTINEGETATFTVRADQNVLEDVTVTVMLSGDPAFELQGATTTEVTIPAGTREGTPLVVVSTGFNHESAENGTLTATLQPGDGYEVGAAAKVTVTNVETATPDVNADEAVDALDALILYYSYSLRDSVGDGR